MSTEHSTARSGIYQIRCLLDGKVYIGSAVNIRGRWATHRLRLSRGTHVNQHLQAAWRLHGADQFVFEVVELVSEKVDLIRVEQEWLDRTRCFKRDKGYNASQVAGSPMAGLTHSAETKAKMSADRKGRRNSPEAIAKVRAANTGIKHSPERIAKVRAAAKRQMADPVQRARLAEINRGHKWSEERRAKGRAASRKMWADPGYRAKLLAARKAKRGYKHSPEAIAKMVATKRALARRHVEAKGQMKLFD